MVAHVLDRSAGLSAVVAALAYALWRAPRGDAATAPDLARVDSAERKPCTIVCVGVAASFLLLGGLIIASIRTDAVLAEITGEAPLAIQLTANQWWWDARYQDEDPARIFHTANELHIPTGRTVQITLKSNDVIHSFWVPNLHGKKDLIPGRSGWIRLRVDRPDVYRGQCAEFCGVQHARMALMVVAEAPQTYERWAQSQREAAPQPEDLRRRRGQEVFVAGPCAMCHTIQGTSANARTGPDLTHLASRATLAAGTVPNNRGQLAAWILDPQSIKPGANMPANRLSPDDLHALLDYLQSLQ